MMLGNAVLECTDGQCVSNRQWKGVPDDRG